MPKEPRSNYAINPTPEQALRSSRTMLPARVIAALDLGMKIFANLWGRVTKWLNIVPTTVRPWNGELLAGSFEEVGPENSYCIEILNDDFTPMEFVVVVLMTCCGLDKERAVELMLKFIPEERPGLALGVLMQ